jgi:DNA gyrase inhibitor GyrI
MRKPGTEFSPFPASYIYFSLISPLLTILFFVNDNFGMTKTPHFLDVEIRTLLDLQVIHRLLLFHSSTIKPDKAIRPAFLALREQVAGFGLDPDSLLHIGVPEIADGQLVCYDCCIEFPLPEGEVGLKSLPGGCYLVLTVEKTAAIIGPAIRSFQGDYIPEHGFVPDEDRPTYEIYFKYTMEYCVPIR